MSRLRPESHWGPGLGTHDVCGSAAQYVNVRDSGQRSHASWPHRHSPQSPLRLLPIRTPMFRTLFSLDYYPLKKTLAYPTHRSFASSVRAVPSAGHDPHQNWTRPLPSAAPRRPSVLARRSTPATNSARAFRRIRSSASLGNSRGKSSNRDKGQWREARVQRYGGALQAARRPVNLLLPRGQVVCPLLAADLPVGELLAREVEALHIALRDDVDGVLHVVPFAQHALAQT